MRRSWSRSFPTTSPPGRSRTPSVQSGSEGLPEHLHCQWNVKRSMQDGIVAEVQVNSSMRSCCTMNTLPKISVVVPSFNQAKYLEATLRCILGQNYPQLELIVIDGGST